MWTIREFHGVYKEGQPWVNKNACGSQSIIMSRNILCLECSIDSRDIAATAFLRHLYIMKVTKHYHVVSGRSRILSHAKV